jgi:hypothetical protein
MNAVAAVAALQATAAVLGGTAISASAGRDAGMSFAVGSGCALAATGVAGLCLALLRQDTASGVLRAQLIAQAARIAVALTLLLLALGAPRGWTAGLMVTGFAAAWLVYPFAMLLVNTKTDRN